MNISGYSVPSIYSYNAEKASVSATGGNFMEFIENEKEEEKDKNEGMVDYLLEALKGTEKDLRMEGNSYIDKLKYIEEHYGNLINSVDLP